MLLPGSDTLSKQLLLLHCLVEVGLLLRVVEFRPLLPCLPEQLGDFHVGGMLALVQHIVSVEEAEGGGGFLRLGTSQNLVVLLHLDVGRWLSALSGDLLRGRG